MRAIKGRLVMLSILFSIQANLLGLWFDTSVLIIAQELSLTKEKKKEEEKDNRLSSTPKKRIIIKRNHG